MKINVEFIGLPVLTKIIGNKSISVDFDGQTITQLISYITSLYDLEFREFLLDENGELDVSFQVLLNGEEWISHKKMNKNLNDGDRVIIMMLVAGG